MDKIQDDYYIDRVLKGDINAFANLIDRHKDMVYTLAHRIIGNREDAEEIAQDTFIKAFQSLDTFKKESKFSTWLFRIVYNTAISKTRKKKLHSVDLDYKTIEDYSDSDPVEDLNKLDEYEQKRLINSLLGTLDAEDYSLITLYYFEDQSVEELSQIIGISKSNVKVKLHRIRKHLKSQMHKFINVHTKDIII